MGEQHTKDENVRHTITYQGKRINDIKDLNKFTKIKVSGIIGIIIALAIISLAVSIFMDTHTNLKMDLYRYIREHLEKYDTQLCEYIIGVKAGIAANREAYCNLVVTLNTILAASVIFFYSVQDNKKGGIPHRTIISYAIGSLSIPILYILTMILVPMSYFSHALQLPWTIYVCMTWTYIIQMIIVYVILLSTSAQYSIHAITNLEIRQYRVLTLIEKNGWETIEQRNSDYAWTYLLHHLIEVMKSGELSSDKMALLRRCIWVPYYTKEAPIWSFFIKDVRLKQVEKLLCENSLGQIYEFYRSNLLGIFNYLQQAREEENTEKVLLILYEFIGQLMLKLKFCEEGQVSNSRKAYLMTVISIMIALMESDLEETEQVCIKILNEVMQEENEECKEMVHKVRYELLSLYIIALEYINYVESDNVRMNNIDKINGLEDWERPIKENCEFYKESWDIWMSRTSITRPDYEQYFYKILRSIHDNNGSTAVTAYIKFRREDEMWES